MNPWTSLQFWRFCHDHPELDDACCRLLGELVARHNAATGLTRGGIAGLAAAVGKERKPVRHHLAHLSEGGHIVLVNRFPHGARRADEYAIPWLKNDVRGGVTATPRSDEEAESTRGRNAPTNDPTNDPTTTIPFGDGVNTTTTTTSAPASVNGAGAGGPAGGGARDLIELSKAAAERLADVSATVIKNRPAWVVKVSRRIAGEATELLAREPDLTVAQAVLIASGESLPVSMAPGRPRCDCCGSHLDTPGTCSMATIGECPHGRPAPR